MSYSTSSPPRLVINGAMGGGPNIWLYTSTDSGTVVDGSGYFTDGYNLGMRDGDLLFAYYSTSKIWTTHTVTVSGTTVDLADGTTVGSSTNTD